MPCIQPIQVGSPASLCYLSTSRNNPPEHCWVWPIYQNKQTKTLKNPLVFCFGNSIWLSAVWFSARVIGHQVLGFLCFPVRGGADWFPKKPVQTGFLGRPPQSSSAQGHDAWASCQLSVRVQGCLIVLGHQVLSVVLLGPDLVPLHPAVPSSSAFLDAAVE